MAIGTFEYTSDDGNKYSIRADEEIGKVGSKNKLVTPGNGIQPETIRANSGGGAITERYILGEFRVATATQGDAAVKRVKITICDPSEALFLNGGTFTYKTVTYRVTGAVGEKRTFFGD